MSGVCPADLAPLAAWWLGEPGPEEETALEEHLFACATCTERVRLLARLGASVAALAARGRVFASLTREHLERVRAGGLRVRTYHLAPDERVQCTIAPEDDANAVHLAADFAGAERVDLEVWTVGDAGERRTERLEDLPVDRAAGEAVLLYPGEALRPLGHQRFRLQLLTPGRDGERRLGSYFLDHSPWGAGG